MWAYNNNDDQVTRRHTSRGYTTLKYDLAQPSAKPQPTPLVAAPTKPAPPGTKPQQPFVAQNAASFDGGKFLASWAYDRKASKLRFRVEVATRGWVSFGLALKAPNNMLYYDVIVGGVMSDGKPYFYVSSFHSKE